MRASWICAAFALAVAAPVPSSSRVASIPSEVAALAAANNQFGFDLLRRLHREAANTLLSPTSIGMALQMAARGAAGDTLAQMQQAMHTAGIDAASANRELIPTLAARKGVTLNIANSIWIDPDRAVLNDDFAHSIATDFHGEVIARDFGSPATLEAANRWISEKTAGKIPRMLDAIGRDEVALVVNAIYFKGEWTTRFDKARTRDEDFHLANNRTLRVPMMAGGGWWRYGETNGVQLIAMPFGKDETMDMWIALPPKDGGLDSFVRTLDTSSWKILKGRTSKREGIVRLPRFRMGYKALLNETLRAMGMVLPFRETADFSRLGGSARGSIYISRVLHDAVVEVNEEGAEAAAATVAGARAVSLAPPPFQMVCDRPFLLMIADRASESILFIGTVYAPA